MWHLVVMEGKDGLLMNQFVKYYQNGLISLVDLDRKESICNLKVLRGACCKLTVNTGCFLRNWHLPVHVRSHRTFLHY